MALGMMLPMLSGYIQEYLEISLFGCFGNHSRINFISLFDFSSRFWKKSEQEKNNFLTYKQ
jgi:hypothetical protein